MGYVVGENRGVGAILGASIYSGMAVGVRTHTAGVGKTAG